ncbi:hypothetical protein [Acidaminococcus timonensis]|uniref:hypothetical protein n=1 Tax=Acidaminococcus timonensis TaxID=1871002 RepID=UPI00307B304C
MGAASPLQEAAVTGLRFGDDYYAWLLLATPATRNFFAKNKKTLEEALERLSKIYEKMPVKR